MKQIEEALVMQVRQVLENAIHPQTPWFRVAELTQALATLANIPKPRKPKKKQPEKG